MYEYYVLFESNDICSDELNDIEVFYIDYLDTYKNGYNLTLGGEGGNGMVLSDEEKENRSIRTAGERNPQAKLTNDNFYEIVELFKDGKTNQEIAEQFNLHDRYVSLIRHKKRFKSLWELVDDYIPEKSNSQKRSLTYEQFEEVVGLVFEGYTNAEIERLYNMSGGTASRIRHKKLYKRYWNKYYGD